MQSGRRGPCGLIEPPPAERLHRPGTNGRIVPASGGGAKPLLPPAGRISRARRKARRVRRIRYPQGDSKQRQNPGKTGGFAERRIKKRIIRGSRGGKPRGGAGRSAGGQGQGRPARLPAGASARRLDRSGPADGGTAEADRQKAALPTGAGGDTVAIEKAFLGFAGRQGKECLRNQMATDGRKHDRIRIVRARAWRRGRIHDESPARRWAFAFIEPTRDGRAIRNRRVFLWAWLAAHRQGAEVAVFGGCASRRSRLAALGGKSRRNRIAWTVRTF